TNFAARDPLTGELKTRLHGLAPNLVGVLTTGGGRVFPGYAAATPAPYDATSLALPWKINVGSGFTAPPMTFEAGGKQYVAILSGPSAAGKTRLVNTPELKDQRHATLLYVFAL